MKRIFTVLLVALLLHTFSPYFVAFAEQNNYCDPIPQDLITMIEGVPQDCIVFDAPDGTVHAYIIEEYGSSLDGYRLTEGQWEMIVGGGDVLNYRDDARFVRHQANQLRPDGTAYGDAQGFDIVATETLRDSILSLRVASMTAITGTENTIRSAAGVIRNVIMGL